MSSPQHQRSGPDREDCFMLDPVTLVVMGAALRNVTRLSSARAAVRVLLARADLARATAQLTPGTKIRSSDRRGNSWIVRVGSEPVAGADEQ
jgi:hypothetical protein